MMANNYRVIDEKTWERAMHCKIFRNSIEPAFCITFEADITNFKRKVKEQGFSFTIAMVYAVCKCANQIEAFRPACIHRRMCDNSCDFFFCYTVIFCILQVVCERGIRDSRCHKRNHGDDTLCFY